MKKFLKFALCAIVLAGLASCSGVSSKYPPTGDMEKDAKALIQEVMKDNPTEAEKAKYEEMAASYEAYYKGEGKYDEFEKAVEKAMTDEMTRQLNDITKDFDKQLDEVVDQAVDEAVDKANKKLNK